MTSLSNLIDLSKDRLFWRDSHGETISVEGLHKFLTRNEALISDSGRRNVAIFLSENFMIAQLLYMLDGVCSKIFVLPADIKSGRVSDLLEQFGADILVTDQEVSDLDSNIDLVCLEVESAEESASVRYDQSVPTLNTEWIVATSGTTGAPKLVAHSLPRLLGSSKRDQVKGREYIWGLLYDLSKYAGLQVYLQSLVGGSTLLIPENSQSLSQQISFFAENGCNALSATPTLWRKILMLPMSSQLTLRQITLGGEIADQSILDALANQFPAAKIVHIYASTEAGVGFSVGDAKAGFPEAYLGTSTGGASIKVVDSRLLIKSSNTAEAVSGVSDYKDGDGYVDTGDLIELRDGRYYFLGRASGLINVGGNKVYPEEIEQVLLYHPEVKLARVFAKKSHLMGGLVVCEIVIDQRDENSPSVFKKQLREHCLEHLVDWKVPALFNIVDNIENADSGKQVRK